MWVTLQQSPFQHSLVLNSVPDMCTLSLFGIYCYYSTSQQSGFVAMTVKSGPRQSSRRTVCCGAHLSMVHPSVLRRQFKPQTPRALCRSMP